MTVVALELIPHSPNFPAKPISYLGLATPVDLKYISPSERRTFSGTKTRAHDSRETMQVTNSRPCPRGYRDSTASEPGIRRNMFQVLIGEQGS
ncbi:hypothetical protein TNCV_285621 [Trichonephila clavipes]|nr:hypothetical protein TNCV_285621 [Trichonephila clavipes]